MTSSRWGRFCPKTDWHLEHSDTELHTTGTRYLWTWSLRRPCKNSGRSSWPRVFRYKIEDGVYTLPSRSIAYRRFCFTLHLKTETHTPSENWNSHSIWKLKLTLHLKTETHTPSENWNSHSIWKLKLTLNLKTETHNNIINDDSIYVDIFSHEKYKIKLASINLKDSYL